MSRQLVLGVENVLRWREAESSNAQTDHACDLHLGLRGHRHGAGHLPQTISFSHCKKPYKAAIIIIIIIITPIVQFSKLRLQNVQ